MFENICQQRDYITAHGVANLLDGIERTTRRGMGPAKYLGLFALKIIIYSKFTMCNLIITKSMIRSPGEELGKINRINILKNRREDDDLYRILFPYNSSGQPLNESITYRGEREFVYRNSNMNVTLNTIITNDKDNVSNVSDFIKNSDVNFKKYPNKSNDFLNYNVSGNNGTYEIDNDNNTHDSVDHSVDGSGSVERKESVSQERVRQQRSSLSGFNNKYWNDLRSVSYSYLQNSHSAAVSGDPADVGPTGDDVWEPLITFYYCLWSGQFMRCLRENLIVPLHKYADEELLLDLTVGSDSDKAIDNGTSGNIDMSEARKKLSKKLFIPLVLFTKALVLPSLAAVALVTGKAFVFSVLTLLVSVFAAAVARYPQHFQKTFKKRSEIETPVYENIRQYFM